MTHSTHRLACKVEMAPGCVLNAGIVVVDGAQNGKGVAVVVEGIL